MRTTFDSLGDIVQLCQLAIQLSRAVGVGCGAAGSESVREYQQVRRDLDVFVSVLMQVVATYQQHELSPYLQGLDSVSRSVVDQCRVVIRDTLEHFHSRYGNSLGVEGSGRKIQCIYKRVEWSMRESERLQNLRDKLQEGVQRLTLLTSLSAKTAARVDNATMLARIDEVQQICSRALVGQTDMLHLLQTQQDEAKQQAEEQARKLDDASKQLAIIDVGNRTILGIAKDALYSITELKGFLISVSHVVVSLQNTASALGYMHPLDPTKGLPAIIVDALGRPLEIPAQWIELLEWKGLSALLVGSFKSQKGQDMVERQEYALEEGATGRDLSMEMPLHCCLRRGMKIYMSMVFQGSELVVGACPRCHTVVDAPEDINTQCPLNDCGMWFRTRKQVTDTFNLHSTSDGNSGMAETRSISQKMTVVTTMPVEPGDFQRVRLLHYYQLPQRSYEAGMDDEPSTPLIASFTPDIENEVSQESAADVLQCLASPADTATPTVSAGIEFDSVPLRRCMRMLSYDSYVLAAPGWHFRREEVNGDGSWVMYEGDEFKDMIMRKDLISDLPHHDGCIEPL